MKKYAVIALLFITQAVLAQGEANNWYFGYNAGIKFNNDGTVSQLTGGQVFTTEGCSSISDADGNLLFYTDGRTVWDKSGLIMPNGNYAAGTGLLGDPSSTQSGIIVPKKGEPNVYYIFTVDEPHHLNAAVYPGQYTGIYDGNGTVPGADDGFNNGLNYSVVDLSVTGSNGSVGDIVNRNVHLQTYNPAIRDELSYKCSEKITAVKTADGSGFWVITHFIDNFYAFKVDASGVNPTPVVTHMLPQVITAGYRRNAIGYLKASPDGKKLAIAHNQLGSVPGQAIDNGVVIVYDFDAATGTVSSPVTISSTSGPYGIEFSREAKKLYVSYSSGPMTGVVQYDLTVPFVSATAVQLFVTNASGALQLGPNGKIYHTANGTKFLDVINDPEEDGLACNFVASSQPVGGPTNRMVTLGLPPFITSLFSASIITENNCLGQATQLSLNVTNTFDSVAWDFGDGTPASTNTSPSHTYTAPGTYTVTASVTKGTEVSVVTSPVIISVIPVANAAPTVTACDTDNNGTERIDLTVNTNAILGSQNSNDYVVKYYISRADADTDTRALNATSYTNTDPTETIFARIHSKVNTGCYAVTSFTLAVSQTPVVATQTVSVCDDATDGDDANGQATINLTAATQQLMPGNTLFSAAYYANAADAAFPRNPLPVMFYNATPNQEVIYVRITNIAHPSCFVILPVTINIYPLPALTAPVTLVQCETGTTPDGITQFNLRQADAQLTGGTTGLAVRYFAAPGIAQTGIGALNDLYTNTSNPQVITARVENTATGCYRLVQVTLQANFSASTAIPLQECDDDGTEDGLRIFDLDEAGLATGSNTVAYYISENDALAERDPLPASYTNVTPYQQTVYARVENNNDCLAIEQIRLFVRRMPDIDITGEGVVCLNTKDYITLTSGLAGATGGYSFEWSTLETSPTIEVNQPGVYTVKVTDLSNTAGCSRTRTITVTASDIANIVDIEVLDLRDNNVVTITAMPNNTAASTTYSYSLDMPDGPYQTSNVFENVPAGMHTVYVYDDQGCGIVHKDISVLEIPKFFTPNGDGINDTWNIIGVNALFYEKSRIYVFDRFGKLLADIDPRGLGWDGFIDGRRLPATDYWYVVELDNGRTVKGHFSLLR